MLRLVSHVRAVKHHKLESLKEEMKASPSQLHKEVEALKAALTRKNISETESWKTRQELCHLLESLLLIDLDYALDKKVEQDLWSFVFRNPIAACQSKAKEQKSSNNVYSKSQLSTLLETASGFYLQLLQKLCCAYDIDLPCHPRNAVYGLTKEWISRYPVTHQPHKSSLFYVCQHCLVHLGDIARYRGQSLQAENFYRHAVDLVPSNGQPYNQLALLEAASGEKLSTVFFYIRSLSVRHPFPLAANNLRTLFSKMSFDGTSNEGKLRMTTFEYITTFLQFHAAVHLHSDLLKAEKLVGLLASSLPSLIIAEKFETWQLVQMVAVCLFATDHCWISGDIEVKSVHIQEKCLSPDEIKATLLIEELLGGLLYAFLLPLHASPEAKETAVYYTLPAVKIILDWLMQDPKQLLERLNKKHQISHALCKLLNDLDIVSSEPFDSKKFIDIPLPEDWDLQCFLPLKESQRNLKFNLSAETPSDKESVWLRSVRLCKLGEQLSNTGKESLNLLSLKVINGHRHFKAIHQGEPITEKFLHQIQDLTVSSNSTPLATQSDTSVHSINESLPNPEFSSMRLKVSSMEAPPQEVRFKLDEAQPKKDKFSIERDDKIERRNKDYSSTLFGTNKRMGKNVAMQAILQQQQQSNQSTNILGRNSEFHKESMVNMNRSKLHHMQSEQYNSLQCSPNLLNQNTSCDPDASWISSFNMHQSNLSNVNPVAHNSMSNYMPNTMQHIIQPPSEFSFHHNKQSSQASHIANKSVSNNQQAFPSNTSPNMMWNYMNFITSYQQTCDGNINSSNSTTIQQSNDHHLTSNSIQQQQSGYYLMNSGMHSKISMDNTASQSNILQSFCNSMNASGDTLLSHQNSDLFHDKVVEQPSSLSVSNFWKHDCGHSDVGSSKFTLNQAISRPVGQNVHGNHPSQVLDCSSSSTAACNNPNLETSSYSLFSSPWQTELGIPRVNNDSQQQNSVDSLIAQSRIQSLWAGPGPSALERLLEQQKQRRDITDL